MKMSLYSGIVKQHPVTPILARDVGEAIRPARLPLLAVLIALLVLAPRVWAQGPPPGVPVGSTPASTLHYAYVATRDQANGATRTANWWAHQAEDRNYRHDQLQSDYRTMRLHFDALRERFNWMGYLALQMNRPYAANLIAELDAGLNIISELFVFLDQQYAAGMLDRATLVRTCHAFETAMREWESQLRKSSLRMGML